LRQALELQAGRRLAQVQALRRPRDMTLARHGHEGAQGLGLGNDRHIRQIYTFVPAKSLE
jgi:hypothetical protein